MVNVGQSLHLRAAAVEPALLTGPSRRSQPRRTANRSERRGAPTVEPSICSSGDRAQIAAHGAHAFVPRRVCGSASCTRRGCCARTGAALRARRPPGDCPDRRCWRPARVPAGGLLRRTGSRGPPLQEPRRGAAMVLAAALGRRITRQRGSPRIGSTSPGVKGRRRPESCDERAAR